ncbi:MgtC/SapB family protein [Pectinatus frisingensis]|nr:MgtC/SapB family protein [Pectinatus frisingensis]
MIIDFLGKWILSANKKFWEVEIVPSEWEACLRLVLSAVLGGIIGYERQYKHKSAGLRTNILVCVGSCLIMLLSQVLYGSVEGRTNADPARLAAQVVSGIGFLGAGAIIKEGVNIIGLTTAACIWVVSGVGLAVGAGYYLGAAVTSAIVFLVLVSLSHMELITHYDNLIVSIITEDRPGQVLSIHRCLQLNHIIIKNIQITAVASGMIKMEFIVYNENKLKRADIVNKLSQINNVVDVEVN